MALSGIKNTMAAVVAGRGCCTALTLFFCLCLLASGAQGRYHTLHVTSFVRNYQQELAKCPASTTGTQQLEGSSPTKINLNHVHGACSPLRPVNSNWTHHISQSLEKDSLRLKTIQSRRKNASTVSASALDLPLQSGKQFDTGNYIVTAALGTPAKNFLLTIDTGSDITWVQCKPCSGVNACYSQVDPIFDPQQSTSYKQLPCLSTQCTELTASTLNPCIVGGCTYEVNYGDGSRTSGDFSQETFKIGPDSFPSFAFGCGHTNTGLFKGSAGLLGLGRDNLAFPKQTASKYNGQFSYCLPDFSSASATGSLSFGQGSIPSKATFTPLLSSILYGSFYFLGLEGISVGGERLPVSFGQTFKGSGTIIDSGTIITRLVPDVYQALKASFRQKTSQLPAAKAFSILDTCYDLSNLKTVKIPTITFHYQNNANVDVSDVGILVGVKDDASQVCLAFAPTSQSDDLNIIGNFQQQRMRVSYDTAGRQMGFQPQSCSA